MELAVVFVTLAIFVGVVLITRWLGAWMLRIDEVIKHQREILAELKKINNP